MSSSQEEFRKALSNASSNKLYSACDVLNEFAHTKFDEDTIESFYVTPLFSNAEHNLDPMGELQS
jgi:hypothetical protein